MDNEYSGGLTADELTPGMEVYWLQWGWSEQKSIVEKVTDKQVRFTSSRHGSKFTDKHQRFFRSRKEMLEYQLWKAQQIEETRKIAFEDEVRILQSKIDAEGRK